MAALSSPRRSHARWPRETPCSTTRPPPTSLSNGRRLPMAFPKAALSLCDFSQKSRAFLPCSALQVAGVLPLAAAPCRVACSGPAG
eukprot:scaffold59551_cov57-Phaeocystis_antarctica.AAC.3